MYLLSSVVWCKDDDTCMSMLSHCHMGGLSIKLCSYRQHLTRYHLSFCQMDGVSEELLGLWYLTRFLCQALQLQLSLCQIYGISEELAVE